jgi:hypothetical protein
MPGSSAHRGAETQTANISDQEALDCARQGVRTMLLKSDAFKTMPVDQQRKIAHDTVEVVKYLIAPDGIRGDKLPTARPTLAKTQADPGSDEEGKFVAQGAREGAEVAGALLTAVNFPEFVTGLIDGVFHSIVESSIKQMEAYGKLVADVAKSLNQFRDENVSDNQGRDHLVEQFPDVFRIDVDTGAEDGPAPRVRVRDGVDEKVALEKVNGLPIEGGPLTSLDLEDAEIENRVVEAARTQLATSRQQLLATMVLMGINRIIVTDGRISAKVMYDFQARDNFRFQNSATKFDYDDKYSYTGQWDYRTEPREDGKYYTQGTYKHSAAPLLKLASASQQTTDASLSTKAALAGAVEVNFKSETFPLEKMADSFQIGRIQDNSKPGPALAKSTTAPGAPAAAAPKT